MYTRETTSRERVVTTITNIIEIGSIPSPVNALEIAKLMSDIESFMEEFSQDITAVLLASPETEDDQSETQRIEQGLKMINRAVSNVLMRDLVRKLALPNNFSEDGLALCCGLVGGDFYIQVLDEEDQTVEKINLSRMGANLADLSDDKSLHIFSGYLMEEARKISPSNFTAIAELNL